MSDVLLSVRPQWCEKICHEIGKTENGKPIYEKRIEVRKTAPKDVPFKAYIYMTHGDASIKLGNGMTCHHSGGMCVIGEFICDKVFQWNCKKYITYDGSVEPTYFPLQKDLKATCLSFKQFHDYGCGKTLYGWHISDLKIYDKPKELSEFFKPCPTKEKGDCLSCDCLADNDYGGVCTNNLTRPPQSWMFVEEIKER